jgi:hypothetical protein
MNNELAVKKGAERPMDVRRLAAVGAKIASYGRTTIETAQPSRATSDDAASTA